MLFACLLHSSDGSHQGSSRPLSPLIRIDLPGEQQRESGTRRLRATYANPQGCFALRPTPGWLMAAAVLQQRCSSALPETSYASAVICHPSAVSSFATCRSALRYSLSEQTKSCCGDVLRQSMSKSRKAKMAPQVGDAKKRPIIKGALKPPEPRSTTVSYTQPPRPKNETFTAQRGGTQSRLHPPRYHGLPSLSYSPSQARQSLSGRFP
jgi:hypothetical protein